MNIPAGIYATHRTATNSPRRNRFGKETRRPGTYCCDLTSFFPVILVEGKPLANPYAEWQMQVEYHMCLIGSYSAPRREWIRAERILEVRE